MNYARHNVVAEAPFRVRKTFSMSLEEDQRRALAVFMHEHGLGEHNEAQALREILRIQLASEPLDGAIENARQRAYRETRDWFTARLEIFLGEVKGDLKVVRAAMKANNEHQR